MDLLMVLIVVAGIAISIANKKNTAKARQQQQQRQASQGREAVGPKPAAPSRTSPAKAPAAPSKYPAAGTGKYPPAAPKRSNSPAQRPQTAAYGGTPKYTHVVQSTLEGGHTHTESSMTGEVDCPPPKAVPAKQPAAAQGAGETGCGLLGFEPNSVLKGVLYAEILGKPKALQRK